MYHGIIITITKPYKDPLTKKLALKFVTSLTRELGEDELKVSWFITTTEILVTVCFD